MSDITQIESSLDKLDIWVEQNSHQGWDPFDALNSPLLKYLTFGKRSIGQFWVQLFKRSPVNLRPLLGVHKGYNPKGMGIFLHTYARRYEIEGLPANLEKVEFFSSWLQRNIAKGYHGTCWGYNFDWPNRSFFAPAGTPTVVNTAFIGLAFLQAQRILNRITNQSYIPPSLMDSQGLLIARSACQFILKDLTRLKGPSNQVCFSYTPLDRRFVHNANLLGAWLLSEVFSITGEAELAEVALAAAHYSVACQKSDGSWWYGEDVQDHWIDNFHTGYVLVALRNIIRNLSQPVFYEPIVRGYAFWKKHFFLTDGAPKFYSDRIYPIDAHSVSQAILTFLAFSEQDAEAIVRAQEIAEWGIHNMQNPQGFFDYQVYRFYRIRVPYMRWSQSWMQLALTELNYHFSKSGIV